MSRVDGTGGPRKFLAPEILYGVGSRARAGQYARNLGVRRALVVSDAGVVQAGWTEEVRRTLGEAGVEDVLFADVTPNPRDFEVAAGHEVYVREGCDGIVAVGGGSPIDCAKGVAILATNGGSIGDFEGVDTIPQPCPPMICVPTTAGTSADISQFCIITDTRRRVKMAIVSRATVPDVSLVDAETTTTMSAALTASTGMDALVHAAEAIVSNARSPLTDVHAESAIRLIWEHLPGALAEPQNLACRGPMMLASLHAGLAFSNASLGAVHAMAHALGGVLDTAHGDCNAILLPHVIARNFVAGEEGYRTMAECMGLAATKMSGDACRDALVERIRELQDCTGFTQTLASVGVQPGDIPSLAKVALQDACMVTNPCDLQQADVEAIYARAL